VSLWGRDVADSYCVEKEWDRFVQVGGACGGGTS
jgi:hypothetical protein